MAEVGANGAGWLSLVPQHTLMGHQKAVEAVAFSRDGQLLASGSWDNTVRVWSAGSAGLLHVLQGHTGWVSCVSFGAGTQLVSGSDDRTVRVWDGEGGTLVRTLHEHTGLVWSVAHSADASLLASGSNDKTVRVWDVRAGSSQQLLRAHSSVFSVAFSGDGRLLAGGCDDGRVRVWDARTWRELRELRELTGHTGVCYCVSFGAGAQLASSGGWGDPTVRVWDAASGEAVHTLLGHSAAVSSVAMSVQGVLCSGSLDSTVKLWDPADGAALHTGTVESYVYGVAFSPDGAVLAAGCLDGTVRTFRVSWAAAPSRRSVVCFGAAAGQRRESLGSLAAVTHYPAVREVTPKLRAAVAGSSCVVVCGWAGAEADAQRGDRWGCWLARELLKHSSSAHVPWIVWSDEVAKDFQYHREIQGLGGLSVREEPQVQVARGLVAAAVRSGFDQAAALRADGERLEQEERARLERLRAELHTREVTPRNVQLLLLGQARVGKTCLFRALQGLAFKDGCESTVDHEAADLGLDGAGVLRRPSAGAGTFDCLDPAYLGAIEAHKDAHRSSSSRGVSGAAEEAEQSARVLQENSDAESGESSSRPAHPQADSPQPSETDGVDAPAAEPERANPRGEGEGEGEGEEGSRAAELSAEEKRMQACFDGTKVPLGANDILLRAFDFAGQEQYYATHHLFLRNGAVSLLVFRVADFVGEAAGQARSGGTLSAELYLIFWLSSLRVHAPNAAVLLVGVYCTDKKYRSHSTHYIATSLSEVDDRLQECNDVLHALDERCGRVFSCVRERENDFLFFPLETPEVRGASPQTRAGKEMAALWREISLHAQKKLSAVGRPYPWFRAYMELRDHSDIVVSVDEVDRLLQHFNTGPLSHFLDYFHDLGRILVVPASESAGKHVLPNAKWVTGAFGRLLDRSERWKHEGDLDLRELLAQLSANGTIGREALTKLLVDGQLSSGGMSEANANAVVDTFVRYHLALSLQLKDVPNALLIPACVRHKSSSIPAAWKACELVYCFEVWVCRRKGTLGQRVLVPCILEKLVVELYPFLRSESKVDFQPGHAFLQGLLGFNVLVQADYAASRVVCLLKGKHVDVAAYSADMTPLGACRMVQRALEALMDDTFAGCGIVEVRGGLPCPDASCRGLVDDLEDGPACKCCKVPLADSGLNADRWTRPGGLVAAVPGGKPDAPGESEGGAERDPPLRLVLGVELDGFDAEEFAQAISDVLGLQNGSVRVVSVSHDSVVVTVELPRGYNARLLKLRLSEVLRIWHVLTVTNENGKVLYRAEVDSETQRSMSSATTPPAGAAISVCVVCARDQEAEAVGDILRDLGGRRKVQGSPSVCTLVYYEIFGGSVSMRVWLTYAVDQSGDFMHTWMTRLLVERPWGDKMPDLFLMTGVCAGKRGDCRLGDVMVASEAFNYEFGKRVDDPNSSGGAPLLLPKPCCFKPCDNFVRWVREVMQGKMTWHERAQNYSPTISPLERYERYIFARTFEALDRTEDFTAANTQWLADQDLPRTGPLLAEKVIESFGDAVDDAEGLGHVFETDDGTLELSDAVRKTIVNSLKVYGVFPRPPRAPQFKEAKFGPWGSGASVRADTHKGKTIFFRGEEVGETRDSAVFAEVKQQNRDTIAVDMEAAAFYQQLQVADHRAFLAVKAVCDFADSRKNDALHRYGKHAAASYALQLALEFSSVRQRSTQR